MLFESRDYRQYLKFRLEQDPQRAPRTRMAQFIHCQLSFVTRVLSYQAHFSLEQAFRLNEYFGHFGDEAEYFLFLLQYERAATEGLKSFFNSKLDGLSAKRTEFKERLPTSAQMSTEDQLIYYSSWYYTAIHILVGIKALQTRQSLANHLKLSLQETSHYLNFLLSRGFVGEVEGKLVDNKVPMLLPKSSPLISKLHANWRIKAMESFDRVKETDVHFSGVYTLSKSDKEKLQRQIVNFIHSADKQIRSSPEEIGCVLAVDFFEI